MSNSLKTNFAHLQYNVSSVGHRTALRGRSSPGSCERAGPTAKQEAPRLNSAKKMGFPGRTASWPEAVSPGLLTKHLCKMRFCSSLSAPTPRAQGAGVPLRMGPGQEGTLGSSCTTTLKIMGSSGLPISLCQNGAVMGFLDSSRLAMVWTSHWPTLVLGFLKEAKLLFPLKCAEAHWLNGKQGELTSSTFPLFSNDLCLTLTAIQEPGGIYITP